MFELNFNTDNAAFEDGNKEMEILRILKLVSEKVEKGEKRATIRDINGNQIGYMYIGE